MLGEVFAEPIKAAFPGGAPLGDPVFGGPERGSFDMAGTHAADFFGAHQAAGFEDFEVLHDRRQGHVERLSELADRSGSAAQPLDHDQSGGIRQRLEDATERCSLVKHFLKYCPMRRLCQEFA